MMQSNTAREISNPLPQQTIERFIAEHFGNKRLRPDQIAPIQAAFAGSNLLCCLPTGGGKSLIYQAPALHRHLNGLGITVVISPLISLMRDQVEGLGRKDIYAANLDSLMTAGERNETLEWVRQGIPPMLYVSPERFVTTAFQKYLREIANKDARCKISTIVIDEAHLVATWGPNFRPAFDRALTEILESRNGRGAPQLLLFSATLPPEVKRHIKETILKDKEYVEYVGDLYRPNIKCVTTEFSCEQDKLNRLVYDLKRQYKLGGNRTGRQGENPNLEVQGGRTIVYVSSRKKAEVLAEYLTAKLRQKVEFYHAGDEPTHRQQVQQGFSEGKFRILVATSAFGMGVDLPDIRRVIHFHPPGSILSAMQEGGRAGRDGKESIWDIYFMPLDAYRQSYFINLSNPTREDMQGLYLLFCKWAAKRTEAKSSSKSGDRSSKSKGKTRSSPETYPRQIFVDMENFLDPDKSSAYRVARRPAQLAALAHYGLIEMDGWNITLKINPKELAAKLPSEDVLMTKRRADELALLKVVHLMQQRDSGVVASLILAELLHGGLTDRLKSARLEDLITSRIIPEQVLAVLWVVNERDCSFADLTQALRQIKKRSERGDTTGVPNAWAMSLKRLTGSELALLIRFVTASGLLREHDAGGAASTGFRRRDRLSLSQAGFVTLRKELQIQDPVRPADNWDVARERLGHPAERLALRTAVMSEFRKLEGAETKFREIATKILDKFNATKFQYKSQEITGLEIVAAYSGVRICEVTPDHLRRLLCYLFIDPEIVRNR